MSFVFKNTTDSGIVIGREKTPYEKTLNMYYAIPIILTFFAFVLLLTVGQGSFKNWILNIVDYWKVDQKTLIETVHREMEFVGTAVWTLTTILSAFVAFYYSALGYRNYGLTNRNIISYTYGSCFIPSLVALNALIVILMTMTYYVKWYTRFYLLAGYSFFLQALLICLCVFGTTQYNAFQTIRHIEVLQFKALYGIYVCSEKQNRKGRNKKIVYYMQYILESEEVLSEKKDIMNDILVTPYEKFYPFISKDFSILFERQYKNFSLIADYASRTPENVSEMYEILYSVMDKICYAVEKSTDKEIQQNKLGLYISFSALFHAFIPKKELYNKWAFFVYLLNKVVKNEELRRVLVLYMLSSIQFLIRSERLDTNNEKELKEIERCFREIKVQAEFEEYIEGIYNKKNPESEIVASLRKVINSWGMITGMDKKMRAETIYEVEQCLRKNGDVTSSLLRYLIHFCLGGKEK